MYLQIHEEAYQTLGVNLPMINSTMHMPKDNPPRCSASTPKDKNNQEKD
jgi:hypothetical protein